jgi:RNA polymerase sigma-70 factor, ECF subfamily
MQRVENRLTDEQSVIARAQRGEVQAFEALVHQYERLAFRAAWLITHDEHEAADAAQEAFLRAYRALGSFKVGQPFRPWLLRIVTNLALNRVQAAQRRTRMTERFGELMVAGADTPSPERKVAEREQSERLAQAVGKLSRDEQALIALRYFLELPEIEVAQALNVPLGTIKSRLHRTLARLREIIRRDFPDLVELVELSG